MATRPNQQDKRVQEWIETNNVDALRTFLIDYPNLQYLFIFNYDKGNGWKRNIQYTLLQYAIIKNKLDIVNLLLGLGADPNYKGEYANPPIFYSIYNEPIFLALVNNGASLNTWNNNGQSLKNIIQHERSPIITERVRNIILNKPYKRNNYAFVEPEENIFGEEMNDGTTVAFLDPKFRGQRLVAIRANGTPTNSWKRVLASRKNPWTRQSFDPTKVELQKVVVGPYVNLNGGKGKKRKTQRRKKTRLYRR